MRERRPPIRAGVTKALIDTLKTSRAPERSPGMLRGRMVRVNICPQLAPRFRAASSRLGEMRSMDAMRGSTMKGMLCWASPMITAPSVWSSRTPSPAPSRRSAWLTSPSLPRMTTQPNTRITVLTMSGMMSRNRPSVMIRGRARARR